MTQPNRDYTTKKVEDPKNNREYAIYKIANTSLYRIGFKGSGGEIPEKLQGMFTSPSIAQKELEMYQHNLNKK